MATTYSHFKLGVQPRDLRTAGVNGATDSALGWGVTASGKVNLPFLGDRTNFKLTVHTGDGYGTQLKGGPSEAVFDTSLDLIGTTSTCWRASAFLVGQVPFKPDLWVLERRQSASAPSDALASTTYAICQFHLGPLQTAHAGALSIFMVERVDFAGPPAPPIDSSSRLDSII